MLFFYVDLHENKITKLITMQLELVIHMFDQKFFTLQNFIFGVVIKNLNYKKIRLSAKS
jgi:hypothetical protein